MFSTSLDDVRTPNTRLVRTFDAAAVRELIDDAPTDVSIGGAHLAGQAVTAGLVDEYCVLLNPVIVGGGTPWLPASQRVDLELRRRTPVHQRRRLPPLPRRR